MKRRLKLADAALNLFGGACQRCAYSTCRRALHFHHLDGSEKQEWSGKRGGASFDEVLAYPDRFLLLCANCHAEEHDALANAARRFVSCRQCGTSLAASETRELVGRGRYCSHTCQMLARKAHSLTLAGRTERFWKYVRKTDGCWLWTGFIEERHGLGVLQFRNEENQRKAMVVQRFSYEIHIGPIPPKHYVLQSCGNKLCVRPDELYLQPQGRRPRAGWNIPTPLSTSSITVRKS